MLSGQYESKLSKKYQTAFPRRLREEMGNKIVITKSIDSCLFVVSEDKWSTLLEGTENMPFTDQATRELQRYLFGNAVTITLDNQGRFVIPDYLREFAHIEKTIIFVGVSRYVEIWDKAEWKKNEQKIGGSIELLTVNLSKTTGHE